MTNCKKDDTCDQPLTKGEFNDYQAWVILWGLIVGVGVFLTSQDKKVKKRYGRLTYTQENQIRELLQESPSSRAISLMFYDKERFGEEKWNSIFGEMEQDEIIEFYKTRAR